MPAFDPKGKTFPQRLDAFLADAKNTYKMAVGIARIGTTPEWQQKYHVAHMFAYNKYLNAKPAVFEKGGNRIAWSHFSDAKVNWQTAKWMDFLKTKDGKLPVKQAFAWAPGTAPEYDATMKHVKQMLKAGGIGNGGTAQVSCGIAPCADPCRCKVGKTRHLSNKAADLKSKDLVALSAKLAQAKAGTLDQYLATFGLHRPLLNLKGSPEEWHVEAKGP